MLALIISVPAHLCAQGTGEEAPEETRCAAGYAYDAARGECVACNQPCKTGFKGICGRGITDCEGATPKCQPTIEPGQRIEICNGEDDDCDGRIDEGFDKDNDRYTTCSGDCNDRDPAIHPDAVERCNGRDDNCNGLIDDGFNIGAACKVGLGECTMRGLLVCSETGFDSVCDAEPGKPEKEVCDGLDNDCNGKADDGLGELTCGVGACRRTVPVCEGGKFAECVPGEPAAEFCGDNVDNDCDGRVDEGFAELGRTCHEGVGACQNVGKYVCSDDRLSLVCSAEPGEPRAEICGNRVDDDCDGEIDADTPGLGDPCDNDQLGECRREGRMICNRGEGVLACSEGRVKPKQEVCDGKDNDCDGEIDDGVLNACGGCGDLPGVIAEGCMVPGRDECATGIWTCSTDAPGTAYCALNAKESDGRACGSDENQCTKDICDGGTCTHGSVEDGLTCDDSDACTQGEACRAGMCGGGEVVSCDDDNSCTVDSCDSKTGCVHRKIGRGEINSCGGCDELPATPGSPCVLKDMFGPCRVGQQTCSSDGAIGCAQIVFGTGETCNGIDDDCDGYVDEELGSMSCGIGACTIEVTACTDGKPTKCVPRDPLPETCGNMGVDDDCNGLLDDVAGLGESCPVAIGTCIVPGKKRCVGDAEKTICVPVNPRYAEDDDDNGVANYCDQEGESISLDTEEIGVKLSEGGEELSGRSSLFDLVATRAAMLPWREVFGSTVINSDTPDRAILLVSGDVGGKGGVAVFRAKDAARSAGPEFRTCDAAVGESPRLLLAVDNSASAIATTEKGYLRYHKIASQIPSPSAGKLDCRLYGERLPVSDMRTVKTSSGEVECNVTRIEDVALLGEDPLRIAGATACRLGGKSILSRSRSAVVIDVISQLPGGGYGVQSVPILHATGDVENAVVAPLGKGGGALFTAATIKNKGVLGVCRQTKSKWECETKEDRVVGSPIVFARVIGARNGRAHVLAVSRSGKAFDVSVGSDGKWEIDKAGSAGGREAVHSGLLMSPENGGPRILMLARDLGVTAARISWTKDGRLRLTGMGRERFGPQAPKDDIFPSDKFGFGKPSALAELPLRRFGGRDLFAVFEMRKAMKTVGEMGFLYINANEPPEGTLSDIRLRDGAGTVKLDFEDPTGDRLTYRAWIRARHGGSLDHWIDGLERGKLRFSIKGDAAVGTWPIEVTVEAADAGGAVARVKAVIARDGTVESITQDSN